MAVRQVDWTLNPGSQLPFPVLLDDSDSFPPALVVEVRAWLTSTLESMRDKPPTPQILYLGGQVEGYPLRFKTKLIPENIQRVQFEHGTCQVLLKDKKTQLILAAYDFIVARNIYDGRQILGPFLRMEQRAHLPQAEITQ